MSVAESASRLGYQSNEVGTEIGAGQRQVDTISDFLKLWNEMSRDEKINIVERNLRKHLP